MSITSRATLLQQDLRDTLDVIGTAVESGPSFPGRPIDVETEFARNDDVLGDGRERLAKKLLVSEGPYASAVSKNVTLHSKAVRIRLSSDSVMRRRWLERGPGLS